MTLNGTEILKAPEKIVSLTPAYTEILFEMGYGDRIVAVSDYCDYPESVKELPKAASSANPDIAAIKKLSPDLVITATPIVTKDRISLEAQGTKVLTIASPKTIEEFENVYKFFGLAMNGIFDGKSAGEKAFASVKKQLDSIQKTDKTFIYVTAANTPAGKDTFENAILSLFGTNIAESASGYTYNPEMLKDNQPDLIFVSDTIGKDMLTTNENYSGLKAVKDGKITVVKNKYFERPSGRITELLTEIAKAFPAEKPEKFCFSRRYERYKPPLGLVKLRIAYIAEPFTGMDVYDLLVSQFGKIAYHCRASHIKIPPYYSTAAYVCPIRLCS